MLLNQIIELQFALVDQHHDGGRTKRLAHRSAPKDSRGLHRLFGHDVPTHGIDGRDLAISSHQSDHARTLTAIDNCLKFFGDLR